MKLATIGTNWITEMFIDAALESGRYEIHSVYSRNLKKAELLKEKKAALHAADSLDALLNPGIDIVYIASPNSLHYEQADYLLRNGKHVICEKPITTKKGQLSKLLETAGQNNVFIFEALRHIHMPGFWAIKEGIERILPVRSVFLGFNQHSQRYDMFKSGELTNIFNPEFDGGAKFDIGIYPLTFSAALFGKPKSVGYVPVNLSNGVCGAGAYILEYDGFVAGIMFSKTSDDLIENQILGEKGGIRFNNLTSLNGISLIPRRGQKTDISARHDENPLTYEAMVFADIIENNDTDKYSELCSISMIANDILIDY